MIKSHCTAQNKMPSPFPFFVCECELLLLMSERSGFSFPSSRARERAEEEVDEVAKEEVEETQEWEANGGCLGRAIFMRRTIKIWR